MADEAVVVRLNPNEVTPNTVLLLLLLPRRLLLPRLLLLLPLLLMLLEILLLLKILLKLLLLLLITLSVGAGAPAVRCPMPPNEW